ncbi:MAG: hypothetical protein CMK32_05730 [Porticoccaceae bacterium]|nr:hypothetical protein [Porticoccaceae bacterium]
MDIKREENESIAQGTDITSFLSPVYIKYYFISLIFMFVIMVYSFFSSNPEIPEIGFWKGLLILIITPPHHRPRRLYWSSFQGLHTA